MIILADQSIEDLLDRVSELESKQSKLFREIAVASRSLEIVNGLINTIDNHVHGLTECTNKLITRISLLEQRIDSFISTFKWLFPSFLVMIVIVAAFVGLVATGKLVFT